MAGTRQRGSSQRRTRPTLNLLLLLLILLLLLFLLLLLLPLLLLLLLLLLLASILATTLKGCHAGTSHPASSACSQRPSCQASHDEDAASSDEDLGRAVQVALIKLKLKPPETKHLKLKCDEPLSNFAFKFKFRRYTWVTSTPACSTSYQSTTTRAQTRIVIALVFRRTSGCGRCRSW